MAMRIAEPTATSSLLGALPQDGGVQFRIWAPKATSLELVLEAERKHLPMHPVGEGYYEQFVPGLEEGSLYRYLLNGGNLFPDPASRFQPEGVHGPSMVVDPSRFHWTDQDWQGIPQKNLIFYELHVGTFSPEGTFAGVEERMPYLRDLGITAVELMPVADWPGRWNWGYDHAALFAPSRAYGTPDDLRSLVDAAHALGLAVFLDVIYNHLGPDGAYVAAFAPMFTEKHRTAWGPGINLDDEGSEGVRRFFIENALYWLREYHLDGLRLDATDTLQDDSEAHFLQELVHAVHEIEEGPRRILVAEDHRNLNTLIIARDLKGYGLDAVWADNLHHQLRNITAGDAEGYYADFVGSRMTDVAVTINQGWYYDADRISPSIGRPRGTSTTQIRPSQCVVCIQNHDQIGNRSQGNRISDDVPLPVFRALSSILLFAPELPLIFQGQEWAATTPFQFFTDHHPELGKLVTEGRRNEFRHFTSFMGEVPDPQDPHTFTRSKLDWQELEQKRHAGTFELYRYLLHLRRKFEDDYFAEASGDNGLIIRRGRHYLVASVCDDYEIPFPAGAEIIWHTELPEYTAEPNPPVIRNGIIYFHCAGGAIGKVGP
jgi:maltooligosyltrehalose trehalohydrolase